MVSQDRQRVIETNRSLRLIKNELETLLEKNIISDAVFDSINAQLPAESSLSSTGPAPLPTPAASVRNPSPAPPPTYAQTTGSSTAHGGGPPALPIRNQPPPPPPADAKPVLAHARALYAYAASDARDVTLQRDDRIAVLEHMNADWWMGRNLRTGQEGIFPKSYVEVETAAGYPDEKAAAATAAYPAPPPRQQNPYNSSVPPMAVADHDSAGGAGGGKGGEYGKKFGKKLGNAAVFGAGATLGGKIVNSIF